MGLSQSIGYLTLCNVYNVYMCFVLWLCDVWLRWGLVINLAGLIMRHHNCVISLYRYEVSALFFFTVLLKAWHAKCWRLRNTILGRQWLICSILLRCLARARNKEKTPVNTSVSWPMHVSEGKSEKNENKWNVVQLKCKGIYTLVVWTVERMHEKEENWAIYT